MTTERATYPRKAQIERIIAAAKASGIAVGGVEVGPDGTIRVLSKADAVAEQSYEAWKARHKRAA